MEESELDLEQLISDTIETLKNSSIYTNAQLQS